MAFHRYGMRFRSDRTTAPCTTQQRTLPTARVESTPTARPLPNTWNRSATMPKRLSEFDDGGRLTRCGFIPNFGNSWLYLYGWQNGGHSTEDGRRRTLAEPRSSRPSTSWLASTTTSAEPRRWTLSRRASSSLRMTPSSPANCDENRW